MQDFFSHKNNRRVTVITLLAVAFASLAYGYNNFKQAQYSIFGPTTISVTGTGEQIGKPDIGAFSFTVKAKEATASEAQSQSATKVNQAIEYLTEAGVAKEDIKTENYSLQPYYRREEVSQPVGGMVYVPPNTVQDGYLVSQVVTVKVRDLDQAGELLTGVGAVGAENISNLNFVIDDNKSLVAAARAAAIEDAKKQAEQIASNLGLKLVKITGFYEDADYHPYAGGREYSTMSMMADSVSPELPTGEQKITRTVNITYEVR